MFNIHHIIFIKIQNLKKTFNVLSSRAFTFLNTPVDFDALCLIMGSLLGDSCLIKRPGSKGAFLRLTQGAKNYEYLLFMWRFYKDRGLTSASIPVLTTRTTNYGIYTYAAFNTYTIEALNSVHRGFYTEASFLEYCFKKKQFILTNSKHVPPNLANFLTPAALACMFMDDGYRSGKSISISTQSFNHNDVLFLCRVLKTKYQIECTVRIQRSKKQLTLDGTICYIPQYVIYVRTRSMTRLRSLVKPHFVPSMLYKLGFETTINNK